MDHSRNDFASLFETPWTDATTTPAGGAEPVSLRAWFSPCSESFTDDYVVFSFFGKLQLAFLVLVFALPALATFLSVFLPRFGCVDSLLHAYWLVFILFFILPPLGVVLPVDAQMAQMIWSMWLASVGSTFALMICLRCVGKNEVWLYPIGPLMRNLCGRLLWPVLDVWNYFLVLFTTEAFPYPVPDEYQLDQDQIKEFREYLIAFPQGPHDGKPAQWAKSAGYMYSLFDSLPKARAHNMYSSKFRGHGFPVSTMGRVLNSFKQQGWGKAFQDEYSGDPLVQWFGNSAMPIPIWGNVVLQDLKNRGVVTATMTYHGYPWQDHFRYLGMTHDCHRVYLGNWEVNGQLAGFFKLTDSEMKPIATDAVEEEGLLDFY